MNKASFVLVSVLLCFGFLNASPPQLQAGTLCERNEKIVFSCTVRKPPKIVSLCSSKELTKEQGYLQYRFGLPGKIELEYPKQRERPQAAFKYTHYFRYQVDSTDIKFTLDGYEYWIFSDYNGEVRPIHNAKGIIITPPSGKAVTNNCRGQIRADYGDLDDVFPPEP